MDQVRADQIRASRMRHARTPWSLRCDSEHVHVLDANGVVIMSMTMEHHDKEYGSHSMALMIKAVNEFHESRQLLEDLAKAAIHEHFCDPDYGAEMYQYSKQKVEKMYEAQAFMERETEVKHEW